MSAFALIKSFLIFLLHPILLEAKNVIRQTRTQIINPFKPKIVMLHKKGKTCTQTVNFKISWNIWIFKAEIIVNIFMVFFNNLVKTCFSSPQKNKSAKFHLTSQETKALFRNVNWKQRIRTKASGKEKSKRSEANNKPESESLQLRWLF